MSNFSNIDFEEHLLSYILNNIQFDEINTKVNPYVFTDSYLRTVYGICREYYSGIGKANIVYSDIVNHLKKLGKEQTLEYLDSLKNVTLTEIPSLNLVIETLVELYTRRSLIDSLATNLEKAKHSTEKAEKLVTASESSLVSLTAKQEIEIIFEKDIVSKRYDQLTERSNAKGLFTQWEDFDRLLTRGFEKSKLSVIAGRTSMGKSFFKTNLIINMCNAGIDVVNICPEQGAASEHDRIDSIMTGVQLKKIIQIQNNNEETIWESLKLNNERIKNSWKYSCIDSKLLTVNGVWSALKKMKRMGRTPEVVFIDLFDRLADVNAAKDRVSTIANKLGEISRIAQGENVHMCLLAQINRNTEGSKKDHRPSMSDLKDCGQYEADADLIFLLYREGYYNTDVEDNILEVNIAKQRDGVMNKIYQFMIVDRQTLSLAPIGEKQIIQKT